MLPGGVCDEVPRPGVGDLVRYHIGEGPIAREQGGCHEGQARVLHAADGGGGAEWIGHEIKNINLFRLFSL